MTKRIIQVFAICAICTSCHNVSPLFSDVIFDLPENPASAYESVVDGISEIQKERIYAFTEHGSTHSLDLRLATDPISCNSDTTFIVSSHKIGGHISNACLSRTTFASLQGHLKKALQIIATEPAEAKQYIIRDGDIGLIITYNQHSRTWHTSLFYYNDKQEYTIRHSTLEQLVTLQDE